MAQIRRKSTSKKAQEYFRFAKNRGVKLSWNNYEAMQPQDGFARLGLTCEECLMGPCRLNPFEMYCGKTVCGMTREQLVTKRLASLLGSSTLEIDELITEIKETPVKTEIGKSYVTEVGFFGLKPDAVNILFDSDDIAVAKMLRNSYDNVNVVLSGRIYEGFNSACSSGDAEFAVLSGIVDAYITDTGLGRNAAESSNVKVFSAKAKADNIVNAASNHYAERISSTETVFLTIDSYAVRISGTEEMRKAIEQEGEVLVVCGENNVKQTMNGLACEIVKKAKDQNKLCIVCGNAAIAVAELGLEADCILYAENLSVVPLVDNAKYIIAAPEIVTKALLKQLLVLAGKGVQVATATEIPIGGAPAVADKIGTMIRFEKAAEYMAKLGL